MQLEITDSDINYAEAILFEETGVFDEERRNYLKYLNTCDLQAVPGSGKTTVLLAKLLILERYLPLDSGGGILVISHTNTAVNEIKKRIGKHCPKLLSYPNFIGTIQSFVDIFLAFPCYNNIFKKKPFRIDNEIFYEKICSYKLPNGPLNWVNRKREPLKFLYDLRFDSNFDLKSSFNDEACNFELKNKNSQTYKALHKMKMDLLQSGVLHFDDAYFLAEVLLKEVTIYTSILKKRFNYVFVDEMQDMEKHQYNLLETIFYDSLNTSVYQRIGDINQSIFSDTSSSIADIWVDRDVKLTLSGSHRINSGVAKIIQQFCTESPIKIIGLNTSNEVKPHLILFNYDDKGKVVETFAKLIKQHQTNLEIPLLLKHPIKVIGWNGNDPEPNKLRIKDYFENYDKNKTKPRIDYLNLLSYLTYYDKSNKTLAPIRKNILNAILRILRIEDIKDEGRYYTKRSFLQYLKSISTEKYELLNQHIYSWCFQIVKQKVDEVHQEMENFVPSFICEIFDKTTLSPLSLIFLSEKSTLGASDSEELEVKNVYSYEDLDLEVATIHSVKGETHTATLYLETFYYKHETEHCLDAILGKSIQYRSNKKQAAKMLYVGFSRPTHLLCFAALKNRLIDHVEELETMGWKVILAEDDLSLNEAPFETSDFNLIGEAITKD